MKQKIQISFGPSLEGIMTWTANNKVISQDDARKHWDAKDADWSIPAWQEMTAMIAQENMEMA